MKSKGKIIKRENIVINKIDVRPFHRTTQEIPNWRTATVSAESRNPRRYLLYNLYADVVLDGHVESVMSKRIDPVKTANWQFVDKEGKSVEAINQMIDSIGFEEILEEIVNSKMWGYSILEPTFWLNDNDKWETSAGLIPRLNYRPERGIVAYSYAGDDGIDIREGIYAKTIMEVGRPNDLGLLLKAAPYYILKRGSIGDWAQFIQVFGNPIIDAKWNGYDENQRQELLKAIVALGSGGGLVRPDGTEVNLIQNNSNANGDLQENFVNRMNKEISKAILGTTETVESSSSSGYAQAEIHQNSDERKHETDITFTRRVLNSRFIPILKAAGFDTMGGEFVVQGEEEELTKKESFEIHKQLVKELGLPVDDDFFYENYGVPKPTNYDQIKREKAEQKKALQDHLSKPKAEEEEEPTPSDKKKPKEAVKLSDDFEASESLLDKLIKFLTSFFVKAPKSGAIMKMTETCCGEILTLTDFDQTPTVDKLAQSVRTWNGKGFLYPELFLFYSETLLNAFKKGLKATTEDIELTDLGIDYDKHDPRVRAGLELNIFKFSVGKAAYQSAKVNQLFRESSSFDDFYNTVKKLFDDVDKRFLQTEYNTAYQTGEAIATYWRLMDQVKIFPYWEYRTIGDERVRLSHRLLHKKVFPVMIRNAEGKLVRNPIWDKIYPPNGWNCRCYVVPRLAGEVTEEMLKESEEALNAFYASEEWEKAVKSGFDVNRADLQEVFLDSQQYTKNMDETLTNVGQLYADHWGLIGIRERQALADQEYQLAIDRIVIDQFYEKHKVSNRKMVLKDYSGRPLNMSKKALIMHTNPNRDLYKDRHQYLNGLEDTIMNPDEVYINNENGTGDAFDSYVYLKYYQNTIIKVIAALDDTGNLDIKTWYPAEIDKIDDPNRLVNGLWRHRRGLAIKS